MKIIVFSDSHGDTENMREVISRYRSAADLIIHLGDGSEDLEHVMRDFPRIPYKLIAGNREDYFSSPFSHLTIEKEDILNLDGCKIFATHGHRYHVKSTDMNATVKAISCGAQILLYGHTHRAVCKTYESDSAKSTVYIMNPGSVGTGDSPTYGVVDINDGKIKTEIFNV